MTTDHKTTMHHRILFERQDEGIAFVAALSRFLSSPLGAPYLERFDAVEVRSREVPGGGVELYLSASALDAAIAAFPPGPASQAVETLPEGCLLLIEGSALPWGVDDAQTHLHADRPHDYQPRDND